MLEADTNSTTGPLVHIALQKNPQLHRIRKHWSAETSVLYTLIRSLHAWSAEITKCITDLMSVHARPGETSVL